MAAPHDALKGSTRSTTQAGAFGAVLAALLAFDVVHLTPEQVAAVMPLGTGAVCFVQRVVENRMGWGFLRTVRTPTVRQRRVRKSRQ